MTITRMQEPRQMYQEGGIMQVAPRQGYFLGKLVKSIGKGVKKIVKSPIGKGLLLAGGLGLAGVGPFAGLARTAVGQALFGGATQFLPGATAAMKGAAVTNPGLFGMAKNFLGNLSTGTKLGLGGAFASYLASTGADEQEVEEIKRDKGKLSIYLKDYFTKLNPNASDAEVEEFVATNTSEYATGGRVGLESGTPKKGLESLSKKDMDKFIMKMPNKIEYDEEGNRIERKIPKIKGPFKYNKKKTFDRENLPFILLRKESAMGGLQGMPMGQMRMNEAGTIERDYRDEGGFVPVGIKEKADDVPAMLSKNEFVMTADAVRGMGNGSIEKGAQRLYDQMKRLENKVV